MATFVLVHGAMHGGWCWRDVRRRLAAAGHAVFTPTLTGQGDRRAAAAPDVGMTTHVNDLAELFWFEDLTDVQLVLHSYAGILAGPLADRVGYRLASIVYLGAFVTADGECLLDVEPPDVADRYRSLVGDGWRVPADPSFLAQWGLTDPALVDWVAARLTDFPVRCQTEPTVFDAKKTETVADWSPYDGMTFAGRVTATFLRGSQVWDGETVLATAGSGKFIRPEHRVSHG